MHIGCTFCFKLSIPKDDVTAKLVVDFLRRLSSNTLKACHNISLCLGIVALITLSIKKTLSSSSIKRVAYSSRGSMGKNFVVLFNQC